MAAPTLRGRTVVVCRAADQATGMIDALATLGAEPLALPLLEVMPPSDDGAALRAALGRSSSIDWLVVTSARAVDAVMVELAGALPAGVSVAVVGPATAARARSAGWRVDFEPREATAHSLATSLPIAAGARVLLPLAEMAADTLELELARRGSEVERVEAYRMGVPEHDPSAVARAVVADAVLLSSPSIARRFAEAVGTAIDTVIVIGPSTEAAATEAGFVVSAVANPHTESGLIDALVRTIGK